MTRNKKIKSIGIVLVIILSTLVLAGFVEAQQGAADGTSCTQATDCQSQKCGGGSKVCLAQGTCRVTSDCNTANYCVGGNCVPRKADGESCTISTDCLSNFCQEFTCRGSQQPPVLRLNGQSCTSKSQCQSNYCDPTNKCANAPGPPSGNFKCGCADDNDCDTGEKCGSDGLCTISVTEPAAEGEEDPDTNLNDINCPPGLKDTENKDGDGVVCDLCPDKAGDEANNGCPLNSDNRIEPTSDIEGCWELGGVACQPGENCVNGLSINLGEQGNCCSPLEALPGQAVTPSACELTVYNPTFGGSISITRTQCVDQDGDGEGTKTITINQALPPGVEMDDIAPECPDGITEPNCQAPCTTLPRGGDRQIVPFFTLTGAFISLGLLTGFYFYRKKKRKL